MNDYNKFPAGHFAKPTSIHSKDIIPEIQRLEEFPSILRGIVKALTAEQLNTKTLPGVWTIQQIIHHLADSHTNAFIRTKLALTEENPTVKPYNEQKWALLPDSINFPVSFSLNILEGIHGKWAHIYRSLNDSELQRSYFHPEDNNYVKVGEQIYQYVFHGNHHLGFINELLESKGWNCAI